jgi:predicted lipoprotein with Yx(FWY)xxD motif
MKRFAALLLVPFLALVTFSFTSAQTDTTVVTAESPELGTFLTDAAGKTLYMFTKDEPGKSNCTGDCLANWPVFTAADPLTLPDGVPGELTQIARDDGTMQVAYNGMPLYYWANDANPGDTTGQGVGDVWFVVAPAEVGGTPIASPVASPVASPAAGGATLAVAESPELGKFLTDANGMTLYLFTNDEEGESYCNDDCATNWPPLMASDPLMLPEGVDGELTQIAREDGTMQVAYNGIPLYYWANDANPGDTTGQGVGDVWFVVAPGQVFGAPAGTPAS